jgi:ribose 5-phosphate isomerase A
MSAVVDAEKAVAATRALDFVQPKMKLGLGTGSTAEHFLRGLAKRVAGGLQIVGTPTSKRTEALARELGIPLAPLDELGRLDLTVDGADQIDPSFRLIKGGGGALLAEKIVATASDRMVVIADGAKYVPALGAFPLPIEIVPFAHRLTARAVEAGVSAFITHGTDARFRLGAGGDLFVTDGGHYILDIACGEIREPEKLAQFLNGVPGVVDHGLFIGLASVVVLGRGDKAEVIEARV